MTYEAFEIPSGGKISGRLRPPPSKSLTQRWLTVALLAGRPLVLVRPLVAEDTMAFAAGLEALGWRLTRSREEWRLEPPDEPVRGARIDCADSGTMLRFLSAALNTLPGPYLLDGAPRLRERPLRPLLDALEALGSRLELGESESGLPLRIQGGSLEGGSCRLHAGVSSQFLSALLLAAPATRQGIRVRVESLTSTPYVELTEAVLGRCGVDVTRPESGVLEVAAAAISPPPEVGIEPDLSAACYPAAAAALTAGRVELLGVSRESAQGDCAFLGLLEQMGAEVNWNDDSVGVAGSGSLEAVQADLAGQPDQVPTLAALAPFAAGTTRITGVPHLRAKESDRLRAMATELGRLGVPVMEHADGLEIEGVWADRQPPDEPIVLESWGDHRIAMSLALVGLRRQGVSIARPEVVAKSYPGFWDDLTELLGE